MNYRELGNTGLKVSEIGFGGEWMDGTLEETKSVVSACKEAGINFLDCWMPDPLRRSNLGDALIGQRDTWIIQGHLGSTWQNDQYVRTRELGPVKAAFDDLLERFHTNYIDIGMIHFVDKVDEFKTVTNGVFREYVEDLHAKHIIHHIGLSTHNPEIAKLACNTPFIEVVMFSINPAFDMMPATDNIEDLFGDYQIEGLSGINKDRAELYALAEETKTALTVMKPYAGGRLLSAEMSPFGVALTPIQCLHFALTRPAVASVLPGFSTPTQVYEAAAYENATADQRDYATTLANAPAHAYYGQCTYCGHCAPCTKGIDIATVNKYYDLATMYDQVPDSIREHYHALSVIAADCTACQACEDHCPFGVKIAEKMKKAADLFNE